MNPANLTERLGGGMGGGPVGGGQQQAVKGFEVEDPNDSAGDQDSDGEKPARRSGRRKIKIEYIEDKNRRHITFSKRKAGIMKKAYELSTLTGTQVLLLVVSETGLVYTFTTVKLQPIVTKPEGKNLIQACLNAPDPNVQEGGDASYDTSPIIEDKKPAAYEDKKIDTPNSSHASLPAPPQTQPQPQQQPQQPQQSNGPYSNSNNGYPPQQQQGGYSGNNDGGYSGYNMTSAAPTGNYQQSPQQQQQQPGAYGQMPQPAFYGNQQQHYMPPPPQQQQGGYWQGQQNNAPRQDQQSPVIDDKSRRGVMKK